MKRFIAVLLLLFLGWFFAPAFVPSANADWRWAKPHFKTKKVAVFCDTSQCVKHAHIRARSQRRAKVARYNHRKRQEWNHWTSLYIPDCIWYGESGVGPEYARYRYTLPNSGGSGAYGKFQFMSGTYFNNAKYGDWSPLDQEIAARREYWRHGSTPWSNC